MLRKKKGVGMGKVWVMGPTGLPSKKPKAKGKGGRTEARGRRKRIQ